MNKLPKKIKLGIMGVGMVGGALRYYFEKKGLNPLLYDPGKNLGSLKEVNLADIIFICVPTPFNREKGFDLSFVEEACRGIEGKKIVVIKSTILPGTTETLQKKYPQHKFLFNPEFLTEATAKEDMEHPDRQILGYTKESRQVAKIVLGILPPAPFMKIIPAKEAELVKYFSNTWFSTKVIFANYVYKLCQKLGIDYEIVRECASADRMIGPSHLDVRHKGYFGYGGRCLPKDMRSFIRFAKERGVDLKLHKLVEEVNNQLMKEQGIDDAENL